MSRFEAIDADGDDKVDVEEIAQALEIDLEDAQRVLDKYDTDGNGYLDKAEFASLKQKLIADKMDKTPDYRKVDKDNYESINDQIEDMKFLMTKMLQIDPAGKRVLKGRAKSSKNLNTSSRNLSTRRLNSKKNISKRQLKNQSSYKE